MTSNNKKINALREGIGRLTESLDERWQTMKHLSGKQLEVNREDYYSKLKTIELLGGDWQRDVLGRHRVFIAGVTAFGQNIEVDDED